MLKSNETYVMEEDGSIHKMLFSGDANWEERATTSIQEIRANVIDEFAEAIRNIHYKYLIGTDADTNEPLYGHEDGTWHNLIDDVSRQMKGE